MELLTVMDISLKIAGLYYWDNRGNGIVSGSEKRLDNLINFMLTKMSESD